MAIKKIFEGNLDAETHSDFLKFGRGEYKDRYLIDAKKQKDKYAIKTSAEFVNLLVKSLLKKASGTLAVKGIMVSTFNLGEDSEIGFEIKKRSNFKGIRKFVVDTEIEPGKILDLMEKFPRCFFALSFTTDEATLKVKAKPPKSGKPGKDSEVAKADFCSLKTNNEEILGELFFNEGLDWKMCSINHTIKIEDIIYPKNISEMKPEDVREQSKRKGVLVRKSIVDGNEDKKEVSFVA